MENTMTDEYCEVCLDKKGCDYSGGFDCVVSENKSRREQGYQLLSEKFEMIRNKLNLRSKL
ncbi:MAG: hypothetical protein OQK82_05595 [Candidatus Pacearchaeota archaeon]|nr:hypothetical protein [Candidatus Pacearchaeota archaeon]